MTRLTVIATNFEGQQLDGEVRLGMEPPRTLHMQRGQTATVPILMGDLRVVELKFDFTQPVASIETIAEDQYRKVGLPPGKKLTLGVPLSVSYGCIVPVLLILLIGLLGALA